jgi:hypothetical protein
MRKNVILKGLLAARVDGEHRTRFGGVTKSPVFLTKMAAKAHILKLESGDFEVRAQEGEPSVDAKRRAGAP